MYARLWIPMHVHRKHTIHKLHFCYIYEGPGKAFLEITYMYQVHYDLDMSYIYTKDSSAYYTHHKL